MDMRAGSTGRRGESPNFQTSQTRKCHLCTFAFSVPRRKLYDRGCGVVQEEEEEEEQPQPRTPPLCACVQTSALPFISDLRRDCAVAGSCHHRSFRRAAPDLTTGVWAMVLASP